MLGRMSMMVEESLGCFADFVGESYKGPMLQKHSPKVLEKATLGVVANML